MQLEVEDMEAVEDHNSDSDYDSNVTGNLYTPWTVVIITEIFLIMAAMLHYR